MPARIPRVAIIDQDLLSLRRLEDRIQARGWQACPSSDLSHAAGFVARSQADLVIIEVDERSERIGALHALDVIKRVQETRDIPVILCTVTTAGLRRQARTLDEFGIQVLSRPQRAGAVVRKAVALLRRRGAQGP
jgi:DNA-binding response OmpR family regulator